MTTAPDNSAALVLFSGGQDSATCLAWALTRYRVVHTIGFDYGQRHGVELLAREVVRASICERFPDWAARLGPDIIIDISTFGAIGETALTTKKNIKVDEKGLPSTFVPGRNLVFLTYSAALAAKMDLDVLVGGMCETDYSGYPDCRRETIDAMASALNLGMARNFTIETPLMSLTKAQTWALAHALGGDALVEIIVEDSHTCYLGARDPHPWGRGCGACPACELRAKGYVEWMAGR